jgi:SCF-associated factor 1
LPPCWHPADNNASIQNDETLWARLTLRDHRYAPTSLAPPDSSSGWSKRVYLGLDSPRLFVWGASDRHRLGISDQVMSGGQVIRRHRNSIDAPAEHPPFSSGRGETWSENLGRTLAAALGLAGSGKRVERSNARLVELQSGGWSFTARDAEGGVWVWGMLFSSEQCGMLADHHPGTLDGSIISFRSSSWAEPACPVPTPSKIPLPCQAESISSGRNHLLVLDRDNLIWELKAWGRVSQALQISVTTSDTEI